METRGGLGISPAGARACLVLLLGWLLLSAPAPVYAQEADTPPDAELEDLFGDEDPDGDLFAEDEDLFAEDEDLDAADADDELPDEADSDAIPTAPAAGSATGPSEGVEEILVQGQASTGVEVDATVSVTQFDAADLAALGVEDISDVAQFTPNLEIRTAGSSAGTFFIRGVGLNDFTANAAGAIAIYQDDVPLSLPAMQLGQLFDIEQLDILKGPQGTGPARNASGGAIKAYSRKPSGEMGGFFDATYGRFDQQKYEGALEFPLMEDTLSARVAFIVNMRDPIMRNRCSGLPDDADQITVFGANGRPLRTQQPRYCDAPITRNVPNPFTPLPRTVQLSDIKKGLEDEIDDKNNWAARGQLRFVPPDTDMEWLLNVHGGKIDQFATVGQSYGTVGGFGGTTSNGYRAREVQKEEDDIYVRLGGDLDAPLDPDLRDRAGEILAKNLARRGDKKPFKGDFNRVGNDRMETIGGSLRGEWELDWGRIRSISGIERYDRFRNLDADYSSDVVFEFIIDDRAWQFSQELQVEGELDEYPVTWDAGVLFLIDQLDYDAETVVGTTGIPLTQIYDQESLSVVAFGGFKWDFLDEFTLEGGVRFNWERKTFDVDPIRNNNTINPVCNSVVCQERQTWQDPTGAIKLSYHLTDDLIGYASYTRGFKSGQLSVGGSSGASFTVADPETVDSFEVGFRGTLFDGRLDLQAAFFHYNYSNYQVFLAANSAFSAPQRVVVNADDAVLYGAELETTMVPFEGIEGLELLEPFEFTSRFGWIESEFLDFTQRILRPNFLQPGAPILAFDVEWTGNRLPNTPRFKWSGTLQYTVDLGRYGFLIPRWDLAWTEDVFFDASNGRGIPNNAGRPQLPEYAIGQPAYWIHKVRLAWRSSNEALEVAVWVDNVENEVYKTLAFDASEGSNLVGTQIGDPRTYGVTLSLKW